MLYQISGEILMPGNRIAKTVYVEADSGDTAAERGHEALKKYAGGHSTLVVGVHPAPADCPIPVSEEDSVS